MASSSSPPSHPMPDDDDLEEGQFVPGGDEFSDTDDDAGGRYPPLHRSRREDEARAHLSPRGHKSRHLTLEEVLALGRGDALPSPTPAASSESDGTRTISDDDANNPSSPASVFMTTTQPKRAVAALDGGWAATGKRGWTGGKPAAAAAAVPPNASDSSSAQAVVVVDQPAAAPPPALPLLLHLAQLAHQAAAAPPPAEHHEHVQLAPQGAAAHPRREYTCKECGKSYPTNQALGGHAAGHRNKRREAEAAAAAAGMAPEDGGAFLAALRRGRGASAPHECQKCRKVFATGVALGGHMRVHYTGPPIVPCRKNRKKIKGLALRLAVDDVAAAAPPPPGLSLALSIKTEEAPSPAPAGPARVVRLFGIDISPQVQAPSEQQPCSGTTTEDSSSAGGRQQ